MKKIEVILAGCGRMYGSEVPMDQTHKTVTHPFYMLAKHIGEAYLGIKRLVDTVINLA